MRKAGVTQSKNNPSALIDSLEGGSPVPIADRGRRAARLEPAVAERGIDRDGRLSRLVTDGVVQPRRAAPPSALFEEPPPRAKRGRSIVKALLAARREGR